QGPHAAFELIPGEEQWKTLAPLAPLDVSRFLVETGNDRGEVAGEDGEFRIQRSDARVFREHAGQPRRTAAGCTDHENVLSIPRRAHGLCPPKMPNTRGPINGSTSNAVAKRPAICGTQRHPARLPGYRC